MSLLLDKHKEWCETGIMDESGLCSLMYPIFNKPTKYCKDFELFEQKK